MFKRLLVSFIILMLVVNIAGARKRSKAGKIENGIYTDAAFNFSFSINDAWDSSIKKGKKPVRITLLKKEYDIPMHFQHVSTYTTIPKITVYADTTSLGLKQFVDSLLADKYKSPQKKAILNEFKLLYRDFTIKKNSKKIVGDLSGHKISGEQKYVVKISSAGSGGDEMSGSFGDYDVVSEFFGGSVFFAKQGNTIVMMHFICEDRYFKTLDLDFEKIIQTFKFGKSKG